MNSGINKKYVNLLMSPGKVGKKYYYMCFKLDDTGVTYLVSVVTKINKKWLFLKA